MASNSASAFNYLNELDKQFSPDLGSVVSQDVQAMQSLHFRLGSYDLLLTLDPSTEVINKIDYAPIPISRPWLLGVASVRGQLLTLIDLKNFLFNSDTVSNLNRKRIITARAGQVFLGLVVDQVVGMAQLWEMQNEAQRPAKWDESVVDILRGIYRKDDTYFGLCDIEKIVHNQRFMEMQQTLY